MEPGLTLQPIGYIRSGKHVKFLARHQPDESEPEHTVLELLPGHSYDQALSDLAGFDRVWLIWWFHRNDTWRPLVQPPRGPVKKRGVFATRSPHRPNPLGITAVPLLEVRGRTLILGPSDLVDGTPVFDIKPYIPAYDAFPEASSGWTGEVDALYAAPAGYSVSLAPLASDQAAWLACEWDIDFLPRLREILAQDPTPHRTRRIKRHPGGTWMIGCGAWRGVFEVEGSSVTVTAIEPGYPAHFLEDPDRTGIPDREAQLSFLLLWPEE